MAQCDYTHPAISKSLILAVAVTVILATMGLLTLTDGGHVFDDIHEGVSSLVLWTVGLHAGYLYLVKRPLARFMLYRADPTKKKV